MTTSRKAFGRAQLSSFLATCTSYSIIFLSKELFHLWYPLAVALGTFFGSILNFLLNRHWSFNVTEERIHSQARRYALVASGSLILNSAGVYLVTEHLGLYYAASVVLVSALVGFLFNFPLQNYYVYRRPRA